MSEIRGVGTFIFEAQPSGRGHELADGCANNVRTRSRRFGQKPVSSTGSFILSSSRELLPAARVRAVCATIKVVLLAIVEMCGPGMKPDLKLNDHTRLVNSRTRDDQKSTDLRLHNTEATGR